MISNFLANLFERYIDIFLKERDFTHIEISSSIKYKCFINISTKYELYWKWKKVLSVKKIEILINVKEMNKYLPWNI